MDCPPEGAPHAGFGGAWSREKLCREPVECGGGAEGPRRVSRDGGSGGGRENPFLPDAEWYNPLLFVGFPSVTVMPKQKTNKATKKRFRVSKNGKVKRNRPGRRHLLSCKSTKRKRNLRKQQICPKADGERVLRLLLQA